MSSQPISYSEAIREAFVYLLDNHPSVFVIGQGLWSPWYVGNTMRDLDKKYGESRIIDTPVSEGATTGMGIGASLCGYRPVVVHPRLDFMILAADQMVNQAAKWSYMLGGQGHPGVTIRGIINRGGEQGAQHSQALQSWFAHIPGLRVVMPATVADARDLLVSSVLSDDPVLYIDDRWLYEEQAVLPPVQETSLSLEGPKVIRVGKDLTLVGSSFSTKLCMGAADQLAKEGISAEVVDLRVLNPLRYETIVTSAKKTGNLIVVDGGWSTCGMAGEIIAGVCERIHLNRKPRRITLTDVPAPSSRLLENAYYPTVETVYRAASQMLKPHSKGFDDETLSGLHL